MNKKRHIRVDDLSDPQVRDLLARHLAGMHENSPPDATFALDLSGLQSRDVTVWTYWEGRHLMGIGALKTLADGTGELKSMRTHPDHVRRGVASALLEHILEEARDRGMSRVSLETGRGPAFEAALSLYRKQGFRDGKAFGSYRENRFSNFLHLDLTARHQQQQSAGRSSATIAQKPK